MSTDTGKLVLRLTLGLLLLFHGWSKITGGVDFVTGMLQSNGLPGFLAYLVYLGEFLAPLFLIAGAYTRVAAYIIVGNMVVAIFLVHMGEIFTLGGAGGWALELQAFYIMTAVVVILLGPGKLSFMPESRWN
ncbi:DoxX family protein [Haliea sp. AH-315-K21]|uniref:GntR family transcriptional regulator n=1 Tax=SAR86 cluster bacterium TaxID=2030880 RepID=A0A2A5CJ31_9GAMM|nr:DoxX family protein [Haliea sp. AH-315-K21]MBN4075240.1 DoxX family protein [Gammaproteobacteria bacterium AH-315-E17]PCJ43763.1 MAG: GntR family transcriptional regulator [SAR86 cluster bacterium]